MTAKIPELVMQSEINECGLACLSMIAQQQGLNAPLEKLRRHFPCSVHGTSLARMSEMGAELGLPMVPVLFDADELDALPLPAVIHYGAGHYVVLAWRNGRSVCVLNPALGKQLLTYAALKKEISGYALILDDEQQVLPNIQWQHTQKRSWLPSWMSLRATASIPGVYVLMLTTFMVSLAIFIAPVMMNNALSEAFSSSSRAADAFPWWGYFVAFLVVSLMEFFNGLFSASVVLTFSQLSSTRGFARLLRQPLDYFAKRNAGEIFSRFTHWSQANGQKISLDNVLRIDWIIALTAFVVLWFISPLLSAISLISVLLMGLVSAWAAWRDRIYTQSLEASSAEQNDFLMETLRGMSTIRTSGLQEQRKMAFAGYSHRLFTLQRQYSVYTRVKNSLYQLITNGETVLFVAIAVPLLQRGGLSFGEFIAYGLVKQIYGSYMSRLFFTALSKNEVGVIDRRAEDFLGGLEEQDSEVEKTTHFTESIRLEGVSFQYEASHTILNNVSLSVGKGSTTAITGCSGEGKTTLLHLLSGQISPAEGRVYIDSHVQSPGQWEGMVHTIGNDHILFNASIRDNITLFKSTQQPQEDAELVRLLKLVQLDVLVNTLPGGINARVSENNSGLSAGQCQRLLLLRALYSQRQLIVMDEPTANLDLGMAEQVMQAIVAHCRENGKTLVIVTHHLHLLPLFDASYALEQGVLSPVKDAAV